VMRLNTAIETVPSNLVANTLDVEKREFFDIEDPERGPVAVDLGGS
jgi:hypothetical protein